MTQRTYSIIRNRRIAGRSLDTVIESGLSWETASSKREELQLAERRANPMKTSWSMDIFNIQLETEKQNAEAKSI